MELIRAFEQLGRGDLAEAGGKGANLGAMVQAGLPVPPGFVVLTDAYRIFVQEAGIQAEIERLAAAVNGDSQESLDAASAQIRALFARGAVPPQVAEAIITSYTQLGGGAVAVRSSATAEDLPDASFAGQQETYLNIQGAAQVVEAVKRCWSSLWTGRALSYRVRAGIAPGDVALAVVIQRLVAADVAGVLFTVDPVSGHRHRMVIDGAWGLGESVVSGLVAPDNWVADSRTGAIISEHVATKTVMTVRTPDGTEERPVPVELQNRPVLDAAGVAALVDLGRKAAACFQAPQDMEWALSDGRFYLLQSRPVTTLFPLPEPAPPAGAGLRVYAFFGGFQGVMEPFTPAGVSILQVLPTAAPAMVGLNVAPDAPPLIALAGWRPYVDLTGALGIPAFMNGLAGTALDAGTGRAIHDLAARNAERLPAPGSGKLPVRAISKRFILTIAGRALAAAVNPDGARRRAQRQIEEHLRSLEAESRRLASMADRVQFLRKAISSALPGIAARSAPLAIVGLAASHAAEVKLKAWGLDPAVLQPVGRSVPHNPTTEMDLALWRVSRTLKAEGEAPRAVHPAVQAFLAEYGHRAVREIDMGIPRWRDDPSHVLHLLSTYVAQDESARDPEHHFRSGAAAAERAMAEITAEVRRTRGATAAAVVRLLMRRFRQLSGVREWHKFYIVRTLAIARTVLAEAGAELVKAGRLNKVDDVFFLKLTDLESQADLRSLAARNSAEYNRELKRRVVPLAMTSEGEISYGIAPAREGVLAGTGASAGVHEGVVRIIRNPAGAKLEAGEVLVAPGTDPAWTPLFLTAGALITETGGMMSHGSVVAREYGIPAVVGLSEATTRLRDGQWVRVDGGAGVVVPLD